MGVVYEAEQEQPARLVAIKLMRQAVMTVEQLNRFERESELLGRLDHPHIARIHEAGTHRENTQIVPYYVMELVVGAKPITEYVRENNLSRGQRLSMFIKVCRAVQHAHENEVLHRDIKPTNLLVSKDGVPKLIDLGISRLMTDASIALTGRDQVLGTVQYMSPEQLRGETDVPSVRWDVYSLGVVLFELLTGQLPFNTSDGNSIRMAARIVHQPAIPLRSLDREISTDLETVVEKAFHKNAKQRYATAGEIADDLQRVIEGQPIKARKDSFLYINRLRVERWIGSHRILSCALLLLVCLVGNDPLRMLTQRAGVTDWWITTLMSHVRRLPDEPYKHVRIVSLEPDLALVASFAGIGGYDPSDPQSGRLVHAALLDRLSEAGAKVVAFDIFFRKPSLFDDSLTQAAERAEKRGTAVVFAVPSWSPDGKPELISPLADQFRWGAALSTVIENVPWEVSLSRLERTDVSLAVQCIAAANGLDHSSGFVQTSLDKGLNWTSSAGKKLLMQFSRLGEADLTEPAIRQVTGDYIAKAVINVPGDAALKESHVPLTKALTGTRESLRTDVENRVIIIGDARPGADGPFPYFDGRKLSGYVGHATAIDMNLTGKEIVQTPMFTFGSLIISLDAVALVLASLVTILAGLKSTRLSQHLGSVTVISAFTFGASVLAYSSLGFILPAIEFLIVIAVTGLAAFQIRRLCERRH